MAVVLDALVKFISTMQRWGAPCFHWWSYMATIITFVVGHSVRLVGIPIGIWCLLSIRKGDDKGPQVLFHFLLALGFACVLDLFLCLFEVHDVCNGAELEAWNSCRHMWGTQASQCTATDPTDASAVTACAAAQLLYDDVAADTATCTAITGCGYTDVPEADRVKPVCCTDAMWEGLSITPCMGSPRVRAAKFDTTFCESFSDMWDVGFGLLWTGVVVYMTYVVHSYRVANGGAGLEMTAKD